MPALRAVSRSRSSSGRGCGCAICRSAGRRDVPGVAQAPLRLPGVRAVVYRDPSRAARASARHARFRERLAERVRGGAAHGEVAREEYTTPLSGRAGVQRARAATSCAGRASARCRGGCRSMRPITAAARAGHRRVRSGPPLRDRGPRRLHAGPDRALAARAARPTCAAASRSSRSTPPRPTARRSAPRCRTRGSSCDHFHLVRGANTALDAVRRERQRDAARRRPKGVRRTGQHARWRPELYRARRRLLKARERLTEHERHRLGELFAHDPHHRRGLGPQGGLPPHLPRPDRSRSPAAPRPLPGRRRPRRACPPSTRSPRASAAGARNCWPTSTSPPPTATPKASSTRSR